MGRKKKSQSEGLKIKDLADGMKKINIIVEITEIGEKREFNKFGKVGFVADGLVKDETGTIKITLWNKDVDDLKAGDKVRFENSYIYEYRDENVLTAGKFGRVCKIM